MAYSVVDVLVSCPWTFVLLCEFEWFCTWSYFESPYDDNIRTNVQSLEILRMEESVIPRCWPWMCLHTKTLSFFHVQALKVNILTQHCLLTLSLYSTIPPLSCAASRLNETCWSAAHLAFSCCTLPAPSPPTFCRCKSGKWLHLNANCGRRVTPAARPQLTVVSFLLHSCAFTSFDSFVANHTCWRITLSPRKHVIYVRPSLR